MYLASDRIRAALHNNNLIQIMEIASSGLKITPYKKGEDGSYFRQLERTKYSFFDMPEELWSNKVDANKRRFLTEHAILFLSDHFQAAACEAYKAGAHVIAYSTSPFRNAANGNAVKDYLENISGTQIGVISGLEEGLMEAVALHARCPEIESNPNDYAMLGIGGGSTQFFRFLDQSWQFTGLDIGLNTLLSPSEVYTKALNKFREIERGIGSLETLFIVGNAANKTLEGLDTFEGATDDRQTQFRLVKAELQRQFATNAADIAQPHPQKTALLHGVFSGLNADTIKIIRQLYPSDGIFGYHGFGLIKQEDATAPRAPKVNLAALACTA